MLSACLLPFSSWAQADSTIDVDETLRAAEQWAKENLNDDALRMLQEIDRDKVRQILQNLAKEFRSNNVLDLASMRDSARQVLPILEGYEETLPYAIWLRSRLDYLEVAQELKQLRPPPKSIPPPQPRTPTANPAPQVEREIWVKKVAKRPWPARAKPYVTQLKPVFLEQKVPAELVWVAEVESSFDPRARSPAGAAGMFQLMPETARRYGLRTGLIDQRYRPEESARAAAKYLRYLHSHFKDWRLGLAAYNAGEGTVDNLLKKHKATTYDGIAKYLPSETRCMCPGSKLRCFAAKASNSPNSAPLKIPSSTRRPAGAGVLLFAQ